MNLFELELERLREAVLMDDFEEIERHFAVLCSAKYREDADLRVAERSQRACQNDELGRGEKSGNHYRHVANFAHFIKAAVTVTLLPMLRGGHINESRLRQIREEVVNDIIRRLLCWTGNPPVWWGVDELIEDIEGYTGGM